MNERTALFAVLVAAVLLLTPDTVAALLLLAAGIALVSTLGVAVAKRAGRGLLAAGSVLAFGMAPNPLTLVLMTAASGTWIYGKLGA